MKPKELKGWEFVKNLKYDIRSLKPNERPEDFYFQYDGHLYSPACKVLDFESLPDKLTIQNKF